MLKKYKNIKALSLFFSIVFLVMCFKISWWFLIPFSLSVGILVLYALCLHHIKKLLSNGSRVQIWEGGPRVGKTDSGTTLSVLLAEKQYKHIRYVVKHKWKKYKRITDIINQTKFCNDNQQSFIYHFNECQKTYSFYENNPQYIPCLISNVTIKEGNQKSMPFSYDMVIQKSPVLFGTVFFYTEAQSLFPIDSYKERGKSDELALIANLFERVGHYIDGYMLMDSQDADNISKDIKRLSPSILKIHHSYGKFFKLFGMRGFSVKDTERVADGEVIVRTDNDNGYHFCLLPCAIGQYNDRHLRKLYPCKDDIVNACGVEDLIIEDNAVNRELYSRQIIKRK